MLVVRKPDAFDKTYLDKLNDKLRHFPVMFVVPKPGISEETSGSFLSVIKETKHCLFSTPTRLLLCLNLTHLAQCGPEETEPKETGFNIKN